MRIDLLDMGQTKYGDCIVVTHGGRTILIDGAHRGDSNNVATQLQAVLGHAAPFNVDLLIITHCHDDHIGQLPELVASGDLTTSLVLAADEKLGWGLHNDDGSDAAFAAMSDRDRGLVTALLEEDRSDLPSDELEAFVQDAAKLIDRYTGMLDTLAAAGARIVRYRGRTQAVQQIEQAFQDFGLQILGPTKDHLEKCADAIKGQSDSIVARVGPDIDAAGLADTYRRFARRIEQDAIGVADQPGLGAAKNDQSIVLKVTAGGWTALLAGDMQFAKAEVPGLPNMMTALRHKIETAGPYDFVKLTHHTSYNGVDDSVLDEYPGTRLFAHTGGRKDAKHPDPDVLDILKARRANLTLARTDRNGRITVQKNGQTVAMSKQKGRFNDFTVNRVEDIPEEGEGETMEAAAGQPRVRVERSDGNVVEVIARVPHARTRVTVTIDVDPRATGGNDPIRTRVTTHGTASDGRMRPQKDLLFITRSQLLMDRIGTDEAVRALDMIRSSGADLLELPPNASSAEEAAAAVRARLASRRHKGVVIVGGFDVVPAQRLDVLDAGLRAEIEHAGLEGEDADDFIVWSDELYGDRDGDYMPEIPVSRIPDGRLSDVVFNALSAPQFTAQQRFGIRNIHRPFATTVFPTIPGGRLNLEVSEQFGPDDIQPDYASGAVYLMLHGSARDATRFWGETNGGGATEAFAVENVPQRAPGSVVFSGCCWGALAMSPPAARVSANTPLRPRSPESSIAISYLKAGAQAFVGCTGSHYSPLKAPFDYFGKPMHDAFWKALAAGSQPAEALFKAKAEYARRMPHGQRDPFSRGVEVKILRQFTCLGLGW